MKASARPVRNERPADGQLAGALRGRQSQRANNVEREIEAAETHALTHSPAATGAYHPKRHDEFHDSEMPPPPQLRRARSTV